MIRGALTIVLGFCAFAGGQSPNPQKVLFSEVASHYFSFPNDGSTDVSKRVQEELGFSAAAAEIVLATSREYALGVDTINQAMQRSILERRLQMMADGNTSIAPESELKAETTRKVEALLAKKMEELRMRLGEDSFQKLTNFIDERRYQGEFEPKQFRAAKPAKR